MAAIEVNDKYIRVPTVTTTERNALTPANGMLVYDTTANAFYKYENGTWSSFSGGSVASWGSITGTLSSQTDLANALNAKEDSSNKSTSVNTDQASNTKYPSVKAVYDWAVGLFQTIITASSWGTFINGLTAKTTPVDADLIAIADSAASNTAKKLTWANLKANLAGYPVTGFSLSINPAKSTTYKIGSLFDSIPGTATTGNRRVYIPKAGTIKAAYVYFFNQNPGTGETSTVSILKNNTGSPTTISSTLTNDATSTLASNTTMNLAVSQGDYIEVQWDSPAWVTNPTSIRIHFQLYIE